MEKMQHKISMKQSLYLFLSGFCLCCSYRIQVAMPGHKLQKTVVDWYDVKVMNLNSFGIFCLSCNIISISSFKIYNFNNILIFRIKSENSLMNNQKIGRNA